MSIRKRLPKVALLLTLLLGVISPIFGSSAVRAQGLPSFYDLNSDGLLTPVKDQGKLGTCWAFGNTTAFQSAILKAGLASNPSDPALDISTWHLATINGNGANLNTNEGWGGYSGLAVAYWTRGRGTWNINTQYDNGITVAGGGPVYKSNNILNYYRYANAAIGNGEILNAYVPPASQNLAPFMLSQSVSLGWDGNTNSLSAYQQSLKQAVLKYGALAINYFAQSAPVEYLSADSTNGINHTISLIGWSDGGSVNLGSTNITGLWILQNSWGTNGGNIAPDPITKGNGYTYGLYADASAANFKYATAYVVASNVYSNANNGAQYTYAPSVLQNQIFAPKENYGIGFNAGVENIAAEKLATPANSFIGSFGIWQRYSNTTVTLNVYTNFSITDPSTGTGGFIGNAIASQTNTLNPDGPGYNLVKLTNPLRVTAGGDIYVEVNYGSNNGGAIPVDKETAQVVQALTNTGGISIYSANGTNWDDISRVSEGGIFFLKANRLIVPLDNANYDTPIDPNYSFTVDGLNQTSFASNTINGLNFNDGGVLNLNGNLTVSNGAFNVIGTNFSGAIPATGIIQGNNSLIVPNNFTVQGGGTLVVDASVKPVNVPGKLQITGYWTALEVGNTFNVAKSLNLDQGTMLLINKTGVVQVSPFSSDTSTSDGVILNNGLLVVKNLTIGINGFYDGTGTFQGNMTANGQIFASSSPQTLTVSGNFALGKSSAFLLSVASASVHDQIIVQGSVFLNGTLNITPTFGSSLEFGDKITFLTADSISGTFSSIVAPDGYRGRLVIEGDPTASVIIAPASYTQLAQNQNQFNVATALNSFIPYTSGDQVVVSTTLDSLTASQYNQAFNAIMPTFYQQIATVAFNQANAQNMELNQRLWGVRLAEGGGFSMSGLADNFAMLQEGQGDGAGPGKGVLDSKKDILRPGLDNHWGMFVDGNGIFAQANSANMLPGYKSQSGGITTGLTYKWNDNFASGIYAGYQGTYNKSGAAGSGLGVGSTLIDNAVRFGVFGTYGSKDGKGLYANALAGGGCHNFQASRVIQYTGLNRTANSAPGAGELDTMLATGYDIQKGKFTFGPTASLQYTYLGVNSLNETGAQSLNFNSSGWNSSSMLSSVGAHAAYNWQAGKNVLVVPQVSLNWQHEFMQNPYAIGGNLGGTSPNFSNWSSTPIRDFLYTGVGFTVEFAKKWNTSFFYNAAAGNNDLVSQNIFWSAGLKF
jgi:uncharacterized protein YhjY with autotransporter beta-barrel domain